MIRKFVYKFEAMTTACVLIIYTHDKLLADSCAKSILNEAKRLEKKYNYYSENSFLSEINLRKTNLLDQESKSLLQRSKQYYKNTNGVFDITIATIKNLYIDEKKIENLELKKASLYSYVGCEHFSIKKDKILFDNEYTKIDLGGFVKEYAVDRAVKILKKNKIKSALVNFGGDIYALGKRPNNKKFVVAIKNPNNPAVHSKKIKIQDEALTTSASYERNYTIESNIFSHIISKNELKSTFKSVTVVSSSCVESGVYSTALMVDNSIKTNNKVYIL